MSLSSGCAQPLQDGRYFDARVLRSQEDKNDPHMYVFADVISRPRMHARRSAVGATHRRFPCGSPPPARGVLPDTIQMSGSVVLQLANAYTIMQL